MFNFKHKNYEQKRLRLKRLKDEIKKNNVNNSYGYIPYFLDLEIGCYRHRSHRDEFLYIFLQTLTIISSALVPFLVSFIRIWSGFSYIVSGCGLISTIISGILSFLTLKSHYKMYKKICKKLEIEKNLFRYNSSMYVYYDGKYKLSLLGDHVKHIIMDTGLNPMGKELDNIFNGIKKIHKLVANDKHNHNSVSY